MQDLGLVPDSRETDEYEIKCVVRLHDALDKYREITLVVLPDDTLSDLKKRVVMHSSANNSTELYAWHTLMLEERSAISVIVDMAMESGGSTSVGPRIVTKKHLWDVFLLLTETPETHRSEKREEGKYLTHREAMDYATVNMSRRPIAVPLGVSHRTHFQQVMRADPFTAEVTIDPRMATVEGDLVDMYHTSTEEDVKTLETLFRVHSVVIEEQPTSGGSRRASRRAKPQKESPYHIDMACVGDVMTSALKHNVTGITDAALRAGFLRKYYPLKEAWKRNISVVGVEARAFASSQRAIAETHVRLKAVRESTIERCVISSMSVHYGQNHAQTKVLLEQSSLHDILYKLFQTFRVTRDVPVVRYNDGRSSLYKVARIALSTKKTEVADYLARRTRDALNSASSVTPSTRLQKSPTLHFLVTIGQNDTVMVHMRQDLSYTVIRTYSTSSMNGGGSFDDVAHTHHVVNKKVIDQVIQLLTESGGESSVVVKDVVRGWQDFDRMVAQQGSWQAIGTTFTIVLSSGSVPEVASIKEVAERMFPFFVTVTTPGDGVEVLYLQYRRVDLFEHTDGLLQTMRLLRDEPIGVMTDKVARAFGISNEEASRRIEAELKNGKVPYIPNLLRAGVSVTMSNSTRGVLCWITGCTSSVQHRRIVRLLTLAVDVAVETRGRKSSKRGKHAGFLSWVDEEASELMNLDEQEHERQLQTHKRYLQDWEEEDDVEEDEEDDEGDDIAALLKAELGETSRPKAHADASDKSEQLAMTINESILRDIQRSDPALFSSGYSTACGAVDGRQPIVVTKQELGDLRAGSHAGAIAYGSTTAAASTNRFICPDVWCPRSRTSMTVAQFEEAGNKCPMEKEDPIIASNKYFKGRSRFIGFLKPSTHPDGLCMPCCFGLPRQRYNLCTRPDQPGFFEMNESFGKHEASGNKEDDQRYLRNQKASLDDGRYGLLPAPIIELLVDNPSRQRCGGREDGSGQMNLHTQCFVRRGTPRHSQSFISCAMWMLDNPECKDIKSFVGLIERHLTPDVFVTLNDGRLAQVMMREFISEYSTTPVADEDRFITWLTSASSASYVAATKLGDVLAEAKADRTTPRSLNFEREKLLFSAMHRYVELLRDPSMIKGHEHLLDLCSRPLQWLNPSNINILMFESDDNAIDEVVYFTCPFEGGRLERHIRLSDPFSMMVRKGSTYHPIVQVQMTRREGVEETRVFFYDSDKFLHHTLFRLLNGCHSKDSDEQESDIGMLMTGLRMLGETPGWQVLDYMLRLVGVMTISHAYIALPSWTTPLVGHVVTGGLGTMYVTDAMRLGRSGETSPLIQKLRVATGIEYGSPAEETGLMLEHLGVFVGRKSTDIRVQQNELSQTHTACKDALVKEFREAIWRDAAAASELVFLRHGFNPLPTSIKRQLMSTLVSKVMKERKSECMNDFVEHVLFSPDPLVHRRMLIPVTLGSIILSDIDLMSSSLDVLLRRGMHSLDGRLTLVDTVPLSSQREARSAHGSGSGSIVSMRKSLFQKDNLVFRKTRDTRHPSVHPSSTTPESQKKMHSIVSGTQMLKCHPWRAMMLAQEFIHSELTLPPGAALLVMENDWVNTGGKAGGLIQPSDPTYLPSERDVEVISKAFDISVRLIKHGKVVFTNTIQNRVEGSEMTVLVMAWVGVGSWYVIMSDTKRIMWLERAANKIQTRIQSRG